MNTPNEPNRLDPHVPAIPEVPADLRDVIARLRESEKDEFSDDEKRGRAAGDKWARNDASVGELRRIARFIYDHDVSDLHRFFYPFPEASRPIGEKLAYIILGPYSDGDRDSAMLFWFTALGLASDDDEIDDGDYMHGFAYAAFALWRNVEKHL
jgi:hypothetical protein